MKLRMATLLLGLVGLLIGAPLALGQETPPASPPENVSPDGPTPRLELSSTEWDFGVKWHGEPCSTEITIANTGDAPLKILNIRSTCGCTGAMPNKRELLPGESDTMSLTYNTKRDKREVSQTITLETNDPRQQRVTIRVKGEVKHLFEAKPQHRITFGRIERDEIATQSIELRNNMEEKVFLKLKAFEEPPPFEVELEEVEPGVFYKLSATTKPPLKLGSNSTTIVLETGLEKFPTITIPASVYIAPRVAVTQPRLLVTPQVKKRFWRLVQVTYTADKPVEIREIRSSHPDLIKAELEPSQPPVRPNSLTRSHRIRVSLPPFAEMPEEGAQLEIFTDDPSPEYQKLVVEIQKRRSPARAVRPTRQKTNTSAEVEGPKSAGERPAPEPGAQPEHEKPSKPEGEEKGGAGVRE
jgi:hypothetical protein